MPETHGLAVAASRLTRKVAPAKAPTKPGDGEDADGAPVDVAELVVGEARDERGADLGEVDRGGRGRGRDAGGEEQRRGGDAVRHAEGAVDELGEEAHEPEDEELAHGDVPFRPGGGSRAPLMSISVTNVVNY